jgi:hypothetical protein
VGGVLSPRLVRASHRWLIAFLIVWIPAAVRGHPGEAKFTADLKALTVGAATGESFARTFTVKYEGARPITCILRVNPPFSISPSSWEGNPGDSFQATITLPPQSAPGHYSANIFIGEDTPRVSTIAMLAIPVTATVSSTKGPDNPEGPKSAPPLWNSWIRERPGGGATTRVEAGKSYDFVFDLSAYDYSKFFKEAASAEIDVDFNRELSTLPPTKIEVLIIPVVLGHGLKAMPGEQTAQTVPLDVAKLRQPPTNWTRNDPLPLFADTVNAMRTSVGVTATEAGCAAVALTIWRPEFNRPLDQVVRQVSVGSPDAQPACASINQTPLKAGLLSLLAMPFEQPATAALSIFETRIKGQPVSAAIFLKEGQPREVLTWSPSTLLSDYVGKDEPQGLRHQVQIARCARTEAGSCVHDYSTVARQLAAVVFQDDDPGGDRNAKRALAVLGDLSRQNKPDVFVRFVDAQGNVLFFPIGLLGLGPSDLLGRKANLLYPLPRERPHDPDRCIASWTMVLPEHMADVDDNFLAPVDAAPMEGRISNWKGFADYAASTSGSPRGEGLVLLTHHGSGLLSFFPETKDSLNDVEFLRPYPAGGAAILAACSIAQLAGDNKGLPLLTRLNRAGIAAAIVSPFDVPVPLGARLAVHFADQVQKARAAGEKATILTLFERAQAAVAADDQARKLAPELDEFLIVGDSRIALCPKGNPP